MTRKPYGMICPITRACEILEPRWTIPVLVALWNGVTKFNELRREIGSISPALLSKRLTELEEFGLVERISDRATGSVDYIRTEAAISLEPVLTAMAQWAQCNIKAEAAMSTASVSDLMWKIRNYFNSEELPQRRRVIMKFHFSDEGLEYDTYWAIISPGAPVEICSTIPGFDVDLYIETSVMSLLGILLGRTTVQKELELGETFLSGDPVLARTMDRWLKISEHSELDGIEYLPDERNSTNSQGGSSRYSATKPAAPSVCR